MLNEDEIEITFVIADLSGYSALTEAHGGKSAAEIAQRYSQIVMEALVPESELVERVGDEVLLVALEAADAVQIAIKLHATVETEPFFPSVHIGIHAGTAYHQDGRYYGTELNLTARIAAHARGGQILCSRQIVDRAEKVAGVEYHFLEHVRFKNILDRVAVFQIVAEDHTCESNRIDPVCRMQVWSDTAPARLPFMGKTYYFCSFECAQAFTLHPENYLIE